jgi:hypothetical protein
MMGSLDRSFFIRSAADKVIAFVLRLGFHALVVVIGNPVGVRRMPRSL